MYCKYCGSQIPDQSHFCRYCGNKLVQSIPHIDIDNIEQLWADGTEASTETTKKENPPAFQNHAPYSGKFEKKEENTADTTTRKKILSGIRSLITFVVVLLLLSYTTNPDNNLLNIHDMRKAYKYATQVLEDEIIITKHKFPKFDSSFVNQQSTKIEYSGHTYKVYTVSAYVYAENMFGASEKTDYVVEIGLPTESSDDFYYNILSYDGYSGF